VRSVMVHWRSITASSIDHLEILANRYINGDAGDAVGTLRSLSSTFSALSLPSYHPGLVKAASNAFVAAELTLGGPGT
jgi:hypothetical protein